MMNPVICAAKIAGVPARNSVSRFLNYAHLNFTAKFKKLPVQIKAIKMPKTFKVKNPWGEGELKGKAGDYLVTNLFSGEQYPIQPKVLKEKYEPLIYQTRTDKDVFINADLPKGKSILSREGLEKTTLNGIQAMEAIDGAGKPYPIPGDYFLKAYEAVDEEGRKIVAKLKTLLPKAN